MYLKTYRLYQKYNKELFLLVKTCHFTVHSKSMTMNSGAFPKNIITEEKHVEMNGRQNYDRISSV